MALVDYNVDWANETKRMIDQEGGISEVIQADVTDEKACEKAVAKTVELYGSVHILINIGEQDLPYSSNRRDINPSSLIVGVGGTLGDVTKLDLDAWDRDFRINVTSMVMMSRYAIPEMRKQGRGSIVNMSSVSGREFYESPPTSSARDPPLTVM